MTLIVSPSPSWPRWLPAWSFAAAPSIQDANQAFRQGNNQAALEKVNGFLAANPKDAQGPLSQRAGSDRNEPLSPMQSRCSPA
jgi:hypothetical protein